MLLEHVERSTAAQAARDVLDRFGVANRLQHIRRYVWRGGNLRFHVRADPHRHADVCYELEAEWPAPVLQPVPADTNSAIEPAARPVPEGTWVTGTAGYLVRVGIDLAVPSAIYIKAAARLESFVPFLGRPHDQVEHAIDADLNAYVNAFLSMSKPVPEASKADADHLRRLGLSHA